MGVAPIPDKGNDIDFGWVGVAPHLFPTGYLWLEGGEGKPTRGLITTLWVPQGLSFLPDWVQRSGLPHPIACAVSSLPLLAQYCNPIIAW